MKRRFARILTLLIIIFSILLAACDERREDNDLMQRQAEKAIGKAEEEVKKEAGEALLLGKIKARLVASGYSDVSVGVEQGVATLSGEVASEKDRTAVEAIVEKMAGVRQVKNQITVGGRATTPSQTSTRRR